jgi:hypothetical protein
MFVNLISGSMNSAFERNVHPSFPEILKQLNEKDARFLYAIKNIEALPTADIGVNAKTSGYTLLQRCVMLPYDNLSSQECTISASVLERAGLLSLTTGNEYLTEDHIYDKYKQLPVYAEAEQIAKQIGKGVHISKGICRHTTLGKEFIRVCVQ